MLPAFSLATSDILLFVATGADFFASRTSTKLDDIGVAALHALARDERFCSLVDAAIAGSTGNAGDGVSGGSGGSNATGATTAPGSLGTMPGVIPGVTLPIVTLPLVDESMGIKLSYNLGGDWAAKMQAIIQLAILARQMYAAYQDAFGRPRGSGVDGGPGSVGAGG